MNYRRDFKDAVFFAAWSGLLVWTLLKCFQ